MLLNAEVVNLHLHALHTSEKVEFLKDVRHALAEVTFFFSSVECTPSPQPCLFCWGSSSSSTLNAMKRFEFTPALGYFFPLAV